MFDELKFEYQLKKKGYQESQKDEIMKIFRELNNKLKFEGMELNYSINETPESNGNAPYDDLIRKIKKSLEDEETKDDFFRSILMKSDKK